MTGDEARDRGASSWNRIAATVVVLTAVYATAVLVAFPKWTVDDAFITYRYAENLARHGELTWNVGLDPVEGYTGVALPVLLGGAIAASADPDVASKTLGVLAFVLLLSTAWRLCRRLGVPGLGAAAVVATLGSTPWMFTHALSGLETVPFTAFVLLTIERAVVLETGTRFRTSHWVALSASMLAVCLIRPEGVALTAPLLVACLAVEARRRGPMAMPDRRGGVDRALAVAAACRALGIWLWVYGLASTAYFAWRCWYYGQLLPNTFYAKLHSGFVPESFNELVKFGVLCVALPCAAVFVAIAMARRHARTSLAALPWRTATAAGVFVATCLALYLRSALVMNFGFRFFVPFLPVILVAAAVLAARSFEHATSSRRAVACGAVVAALCVAQFGLNVARLGRSVREARATERLLADEHHRVARFLRDELPADATIVVVVDAGAIPFESGLRTIDFGGLNDEFLAHRFRNRTPKDAIVDYFYAANPAALVFTSRFADRIEGPEPVRVEQDPRFGRYVLARVFSSASWPEYHQLVYLRRDLVTDDREPFVERRDRLFGAAAPPWSAA